MFETFEKRFEADHAWHLRRIAEEREAAQRADEDKIERLQRRIAELEAQVEDSRIVRPYGTSCAVKRIQ
jgi:hypothetical protein